jgi:hypothetical protein
VRRAQHAIHRSPRPTPLTTPYTAHHAYTAHRVVLRSTRPTPPAHATSPATRRPRHARCFTPATHVAPAPPISPTSHRFFSFTHVASLHPLQLRRLASLDAPSSLDSPRHRHRLATRRCSAVPLASSSSRSTTNPRSTYRTGVVSLHDISQPALQIVPSSSCRTTVLPSTDSTRVALLQLRHCRRLAPGRRVS